MRRLALFAACLLAGPCLAEAQEPPPPPMPPPSASGDQAPPPAEPGAPPADQAPPEQMAPPSAMARGPRHPMRQRFEAANITHDGRLTLEQAQAGHLPGVVKHFREIDAQGKGYITFQDWTSWLASRRRGEMPPPPQ